jgi:hypothetical protein
MPTPFEYIQFSLGVYAASKRNEIDAPPNWERKDWQPDGWSGFSAGVYINSATNELVISYTGTNDGADKVNWVAGAGLPQLQIFDAVAYYLAVRKAFPGIPADKISFTGHSLGGGLASVMAVFFNKQATVFDEAPFQPAAMSPLVLAGVAALMLASGSVDPDLTPYLASSGLLALVRESNVTHYYVDGEALSYIRGSENTLIGGSDNPILLGDSTAGAVDRHSI